MATYTLEQLHESTYLPCSKCEDGINPSGKKCNFCDGAGFFVRPIIADICKLIKGRKDGTLRSKRPDDNRAYFVWRHAKFFGDPAHCSIPMFATVGVLGDPYVPYLEEIARQVARTIYGTADAGPGRWRQAMGYED